MHNHSEFIRRGLWPDFLTRQIHPGQISEEASLADGVHAHDQHLGLGGELLYHPVGGGIGLKDIKH